MPGPDGTAIVPSAAITNGSVMSSWKYRDEALVSPGRVKPGIAASARYAAGLEQAAHAPLLDVHDAARAELERGRGVGGRADRLVETDVGGDLPLEHSVVHEVLVMQRLLDHEQPVRVEVAEGAEVLERVRGVRVDGQHDVGVGLADGADAFDVDAGLDLQATT